MKTLVEGSNEYSIWAALVMKSDLLPWRYQPRQSRFGKRRGNPRGCPPFVPELDHHKVAANRVTEGRLHVASHNVEVSSILWSLTMLKH